MLQSGHTTGLVPQCIVFVISPMTVHSLVHVSCSIDYCTSHTMATSITLITHAQNKHAYGDTHTHTHKAQN